MYIFLHAKHCPIKRLNGGFSEGEGFLLSLIQNILDIMDPIVNFIKCSQNEGLKGSLPWLCLHLKKEILYII